VIGAYDFGIKTALVEMNLCGGNYNEVTDGIDGTVGIGSTKFVGTPVGTD
jgi:hypothetical protein